MPRQWIYRTGHLDLASDIYSLETVYHVVHMVCFDAVGCSAGVFGVIGCGVGVVWEKVDMVVGFGIVVEPGGIMEG